MTAGPTIRNGVQVDKWPDVSWRRLIEAVTDPSRVWAMMPRCRCCGRYLAGSDCEPDRHLCWSSVTGNCH